MTKVTLVLAATVVGAIIYFLALRFVPNYAYLMFKNQIDYAITQQLTEQRRINSELNIKTMALETQMNGLKTKLTGYEKAEADARARVGKLHKSAVATQFSEWGY